MHKKDLTVGCCEIFKGSIICPKKFTDSEKKEHTTVFLFPDLFNKLGCAGILIKNGKQQLQKSFVFK